MGLLDEIYKQGLLAQQPQGALSEPQPTGLLGALYANPLIQRQVASQRAAYPRVIQETPQQALDLGAGLLSMVPVAGDAMGLAADLNRYKDDPSSRTMGNFGLTGLGLLPFIPGMTAGVGKVAAKMLDDDITPLADAARKAPSMEEFRRGATQSHLTDLSNHEMHRFGRAIPPYKGEPYTDIGEILANGNRPGSYLDTLKYEAPGAYKQVISPKKTVTVYRAVPKDAGDKIRVGDYVALEERYARMHGESVLGAQQGVKWKLVKEEVPKADIVWGNADFNEWAYSPRKLRDQYPSLEDFYAAAKR